MDNKLRDRLGEIAALVQERAASSQEEGTKDVSPTLSRRQKDRLRTVVSSNYVALDELDHVFQDVSSTSALGYFGEEDVALIREAASSLSDARRALRRLANREWLNKKSGS